MTKLVRRTLEVLVTFFAFYAFVFVPLGDRTGLEHAKAIFSTPEAKRAGREIKTASGRMLDELLDFDPGSYRGEPVLPKLPELPTLNPIDDEADDASSASAEPPGPDLVSTD